jgi:hypothetical protein
MSDNIINFSKNQKMPPGYRVEWWECDEHYHWVIDDDNYSQCFACRFHCRRAAWIHYKTIDRVNKICDHTNS